MKQLGIKSKTAKHLREGRRLIQEQNLAFGHMEKEGEQVEIVDENHRFIGMAYLGKQNKGIGWIYSSTKGEKLDTFFFSKAIQEAKEKRSGLFHEDTNAYRLFNGEGDGIGGFSLDWYNGYILIQWYSIGIYRYRKEILEAIHHVYPDVLGIVGKNRFKRGENLPVSEVLDGHLPPEDFFITENGIHYRVRLNEGWMTGIFLDQREVRNRIKNFYASGKKVLNLFSYTGAFSVASAVGGAVETTDVDLANRTVDLVQEQFQLNDQTMDKHRVFVRDVFSFLRYAKKNELSYDLVIMDPPSFAHGKKTSFSVKQDTSRLVQEALEVLSQDGILIASTNYAQMSKERFKKEIQKGANESQLKIQFIDYMSLGKDFPVPKESPESDYLKVWVIQRI